MLVLNKIFGNVSDPEVSEKIHQLEHSKGLEKITLSAGDTARKRLRVTTDKGTDCAVILDRSSALENGAVLFIDEYRAIVTYVSETEWLRLRPRDMPAALELGYFVGNMHWRVRYRGNILEVAIDGLEKNYRERLADQLLSGTIEFVDEQ